MAQPFPPSAAIDHALGEVIREARSRGIRLSDAVSPGYPHAENSLVIWFFYQNETDVLKYEQCGTNKWMKDKFIEELDAAKRQFRFSVLPEATFMFDSTENIAKNYQGSYYLRMK